MSTPAPQHEQAQRAQRAEQAASAEAAQRADQPASAEPARGVGEQPASAHPTDSRPAGPGRRQLLGAGGIGAALGLVGFAGGWGSHAVAGDQIADHVPGLGGDGSTTSGSGSTKGPGDAQVPFTGEHQAGITTPAQDRLYFAAFDLNPGTTREQVVTLLKAWTQAAARMTRGEPARDLTASYDAPPPDTGEALDLSAAHLTLTFGFGPTFFEKDGEDRLGIADRKPALLEPLPHFPGDQIDQRISHGDLCVQACADDPQVAFHAIRNLARIGFGTVSMRWSQLGFGRTSSTSTDQQTPRNLFGFKDGTNNLKAEETDGLDQWLWVGADDDPAASWLIGGTYLASRRISMVIETWDRAPLREQEMIVGRTRVSGAPLSGGEEFTAPDFHATGRGDKPLIDPASHVAVVHPTAHEGARMLRRGYNFTDGATQLGHLDAGLFFLAYVRNPATQFIPVQTAMSRDDLMMEYLKFTSSGLWAVPPGVATGPDGEPTGYVGEGIFD